MIPIPKTHKIQATMKSINRPNKALAVLALALTLLALPSRAHAQSIDLNAAALVDAGVALADGNAVPVGALMAFGYYSTALSTPLTGVTSMSDILNPGGANPFTTIFTGSMGYDLPPVTAGLFSAGITSTDASIVGRQLFFIIGNSSVSLSAATQAGVFSSSSWVIPALGDPTPSSFTADISEVPRDSTGIFFGTNGIGTPVTEGIVDPAAANYNLQAVPEPSTYALLALSGLAIGGYAMRRRRRA
jgi:hypothetical protein